MQNLACLTTSRFATMVLRRLPAPTFSTGICRRTLVAYSGTATRLSCKYVSKIQKGEYLQPGSRLLQHRRLAAFSEESLSNSLPEPGTPEAPPEVPPEITYVPGTDTPAVSKVSAFPDGSALSEDPDFIAEESIPADPSNAAASSALDGAILEAVAASEMQPSSLPEKDEFDLQWSLYMDKLKVLGLYTAQHPSGDTMTPLAAAKRASLECGRVRPDALYDLDPTKVRKLAASWEQIPGTNALTDRKCVNAMRRLQASYVQQDNLAVGQGGAASFLDVTRSLWAIHCDLSRPEVADQLPAGLAIAGAALLPDILSILDRPPSQAALAQAESAEAARQAQQEQYKLAETKNDFRPGDWSCPECSAHNFRRNFECFKCRAPRPEGADTAAPARGGWFEPGARGRSSAPPEMRPGDWMCPDCNAHNFASKTACFRCHLPRPEGAGFQGGSFQAAGGGGGGGGRSFERRPPRGMDAKPGDWTCSECKTMNFARRDECFGCGAPKSLDAEVVPGNSFAGRSQFDQRGSMRPGRGGAGSYNTPEKRPGDWHCPECSAHNFASKEQCYRCGIDKPPGSEYLQDGSDTDFSGSRRNFGGAPRGRRSDSLPSPAEDLEW